MLAFGPKKSSYISENPDSANASESPSVASSASTPGSVSQAGSYTDYNPDSIASTRGKKILFFHAPWCPQCRALDASIKAGKIPEDVTIYKVDYDTNQALRKKYGVTTQTTLVLIDDNGQLVKKYVAYDSPKLESLISNLL